MEDKIKSFFELETGEYKVDTNEEIQWIEREILKHFRIENFQEYLRRSGLSGFYKDLIGIVKKLLRYFMYYNTILDLKEEKERRERLKLLEEKRFVLENKNGPNT